MVSEVLSLLALKRGGIYADGTLGGGGHAHAILERLPAGSRLIGIDRDRQALAAATERLKDYGEVFTPVHGNFHALPEICPQGLDGILLDLGVSSHQLDTAERGFSYRQAAPLDMRMDQSGGLTAADVVNTWSEAELARIFRDYGEERFAKRIAARIVERRPFTDTVELAGFIAGCIPAKFRERDQHPARRCFQALRIAVNDELAPLPDALQKAHDLLAPDGRLVVLTFHSLEDRIVKQTFARFASPCTCDPRAPICTCGLKPTGRILTRKPITASAEELTQNSRSACAKLRAFERNA
ncbi:MAG: 16S rRNA (cytosine(1402)-N(4))-methyltransferase RsmH [Clostridiales bacterium]|nr:16S rRNA (cytosine(1402)-N(4))-methyltransferase RsmH [Clostridiales bacterium]